MKKPTKEAPYQQISNHNTSIRTPGKITALYCRLSKEEAERSESMSIANQRKILLKFCADNGFKNPKVFEDDGETGVFFDRPGLNDMLAEIRAGNVGTVIIKDQSRIGREVIEIGLLKRTFDEYNVRFMSAEDGLDTAKGFDIMSLLRDVFNEWFVADTSKKIRAVLKRKGTDGEPLSTTPPYGYKKDPDNPKHWIIDEPAAKVVHQIFQYCMDGLGPYHIAKRLWDDKIETPRVYANNAGIRKHGRTVVDPHKWQSATVIQILERREYLGYLINFKTFSKSYKNRKRLFNDPSEYAVFENAHPPIIEEAVFERVQQIRAGKRRRNRNGRVGLLSGLVFCADCKAKMSLSSGSCLKPEQDNYSCVGFREKKTQCNSSHFIRRMVLEQVVLEHIQKVTAFAAEHENALVQKLESLNTAKIQKNLTADKKSLAKSEARIKELDEIVRQLFEKNALGIISDERFVTLSEGYELEQKDLKTKAETLRTQIEKQLETCINVDKFLEQVRKYTRATELTTVMLNELIKRVEVHSRDKPYSKSVQQIDIHFNYVGIIGRLDLQPKPSTKKPPLIPAETQFIQPEVKQLERIPIMSAIND